MSHKVRFALPEPKLGDADIEFMVSENNQKFGILEVSRGAIVWVPRDLQRGYKMSWRSFDLLMTRRGIRER